VNAADAAGELVNRMLRGQALLPFPEASQDLAMLAYTIDRQGAMIGRVRKLAKTLADADPEPVRSGHVADEILDVLDGAP
jgi:hypothetical protein